eukprot:5775266-Karenia_brevis.AAC.1
MHKLFVTYSMLVIAFSCRELKYQLVLLLHDLLLICNPSMKVPNDALTFPLSRAEATNPLNSDILTQTLQHHDRSLGLMCLRMDGWFSLAMRSFILTGRDK